jgi:hypothetical protein
LLLPNTDVKGNFTGKSPFAILAEEQAKGKRSPLVYHTKDVDGNDHTYEMSFTECVEPTDETMIMGDPFFRKWVVMHDLEDLNNKKMGLAPRASGYQLGATTDRSILTPGHSPQNQLAETAKSSPVTKIHAKRKLRDQKFVQALHETKKALAQSSELHQSLVDKVAVKSQSMVTYNIQLAVGSPPQPLDVIFDTGSFMLAVFAEPPPVGMKPLLKDTPKKSAAKAKVASAAAGVVDAVKGKTPQSRIQKMVQTVKSHVARMDAHREKLAQVQHVTVSSWGGVSGGYTAAGIAVCSVFVVVGLFSFIKRRRHRLVNGQESYGSF